MPDLVFTCCYTGAAGRGTGITTFTRSPSGDLTPVATLPLESPSWLTRHPSLPVLYAANETETGGVTALALGERLSVLGTAETGGAHPCHLAVTPDGRFLLCANYSGGSVAVFALSPSGEIVKRTTLVKRSGRGPVPGRQEAAHVHMVVPAADSTIVSAVDLGTDEIRSYTLTSSGTLERLAVSVLPPGTGPRQLVRREGTDLAYVVGELAGTLVTMRETSPGMFDVVSIVPATAADTGVPNLVAHLELSGERLYLSNRGPDCVTEFALDDTVAVTDQPCGANPRHFALVDGTCYVAAQDEDAITAFTLTASGEAELRYHPTGSPTFVLPVSLP